MRLRPAESGDLSQILALNEAAVPAVNRVDRERMAWFLERACYFRVAACEGETVAFLIALPPGLDYTSPNYRWFCQRGDDFVYIDRIAVDTTRRRAGLGRRLYRDLARRALDCATRLTCEVNLRPPNPRSIAFHRALGFREVGRQETEGGTKEVSLMEKLVG